MTQVSYEEACARVLELPAHTKKNPFEETKAFYEWLDRPGGKCRIFHIAGTNGKGSVCAYLDSILTGAGFRVGVFTSPHLADLRERLVCDKKWIGKETFAKLYGELEERLAAYGRNFYPTFFETLFFLFMLWMEEEQPEFTVLETGMGGLADVTNVVEKPLVCVITTIGLDHCQYLGNTVEEIAAQKAGIFQPGVPAVYLDAGEGIRSVFVKRAGEVGAPLFPVSKTAVKFSKKAKNKIDFLMESAYYKYIEACLHTEALYQAQNAALAVRALEAAGLSDRLTAEQIERGLASMCWPGRMEEVLPSVFVDGAHNPDGIAAFLESVAEDGCPGRRFLLFGASADKSIQEMFHLLKSSKLFFGICGTVISGSRGMTEADFEKLRHWDAAAVFQDSARALGALMRQAEPGDRIYAVGSLYLVGEIERFAKRRREEQAVCKKAQGGLL